MHGYTRVFARLNQMIVVPLNLAASFQININISTAYGRIGEPLPPKPTTNTDERF